MPQILYRYLILEILPPFGVSLLGFTSIVFLGRMMKVTQMIVVKGVGLIDVLKTCVFLLPYLLVFTLPMAATVGILLAMTRLTVDQEMIAMKTAGLELQPTAAADPGVFPGRGAAHPVSHGLRQPLGTAGHQGFAEGCGQAAGRPGHPGTDL